MLDSAENLCDNPDVNQGTAAKESGMSEITIMGCDGCQKAATARRPVRAVVVTINDAAQHVITFDAHDFECIRRYFSRLNKAAKETAKTEREASAASKPKAKAS